MTDLRAVYDALTTRMGECRWGFEIDPDNYWWLTLGGHRSQRTKWRPADEVDVLIAVALLHSLNEAGEMPLTPRFLAAAKQARMDEADLRSGLNQRAFHLFIRLRTGRARPPVTVPPGWRP